MYLMSANEVFYNGDRIKEIRKRTGLTQKEFAEFYNIPIGTLRNWEQNRTVLPDYVFDLLHRCISEDEEAICKQLSDDDTLKDGWRKAYNFIKLI